MVGGTKVVKGKEEGLLAAASSPPPPQWTFFVALFRFFSSLFHVVERAIAGSLLSLRLFFPISNGETRLRPPFPSSPRRTIENDDDDGGGISFQCFSSPAIASSRIPSSSCGSFSSSLSLDETERAASRRGGEDAERGGGRGGIFGGGVLQTGVEKVSILASISPASSCGTRGDGGGGVRGEQGVVVVSRGFVVSVERPAERPHCVRIHVSHSPKRCCSRQTAHAVCSASGREEESPEDVEKGDIRGAPRLREGGERTAEEVVVVVVGWKDDTLLHVGSPFWFLSGTCRESTVDDGGGFSSFSFSSWTCDTGGLGVAVLSFSSSVPVLLDEGIPLASNEMEEGEEDPPGRRRAFHHAQSCGAVVRRFSAVYPAVTSAVESEEEYADAWEREGKTMWGAAPFFVLAFFSILDSVSSSRTPPCCRSRST